VTSNRGQAAPHFHRESARADPSPEKSVSVREGYERWAPTYDSDLNPLLALEERKLVPLISRLQGKRVLDLACGTGRWLAQLLARGAAFGVGMDLSAAMLAGASGKPALQKRLVLADCGAIPFADGVFDLVICSFALGHIPDIANMAREVRRVTSAGADLFWSDLHPVAHARGWRTGFRDRQGAAQIARWPRSVRESVTPWIDAGFECKHFAGCRLGKAERPILARAGKDHLFQKARQTPAVLLCHFKRPVTHQAY
jgi:ubiquinone/menaquinone biosynthesis C-methylase UbiE